MWHSIEISVTQHRHCCVRKAKILRLSHSRYGRSIEATCTSYPPAEHDDGHSKTYRRYLKVGSVAKRPFRTIAGYMYSTGAYCLFHHGHLPISILTWRTYCSRPVSAHVINAQCYTKPPNPHSTSSNHHPPYTTLSNTKHIPPQPSTTPQTRLAAEPHKVHRFRTTPSPQTLHLA